MKLVCIWLNVWLLTDLAIQPMWVGVYCLLSWFNWFYSHTGFVQSESGPFFVFVFIVFF